jgi:hypothetical protein
MQAQILGQIQSFLPCRTRAVAGGCVVVRNVVPSEEAISAKAAAEEHLVDRGFPGWLLVNVMRCHAMRGVRILMDFVLMLILESSFGVCNNVHENAIKLK